MNRLVVLTLLLASSHALAQETPAFSKTTALRAKLLTFLTGAEQPGVVADPIPGLTQHEPPPSWLVTWQSNLLRDLQAPDLKDSQHPLVRATIQVVQLHPGGRTPFQIVAAGPLPPDVLTCPRDAPPRLRIQTLHPGDDVQPPWLGVDIACVDAKPSLRRQIHLLVQATPQGQVQRAFGVAWLEPLPLTSQPEPRATPDFVLHPTVLDKRFTWLVALPAGGWLTQLQSVPTALWQSENALPRFEDMAAGEDPASTASDHTDAQRYTLLLHDDGTPRAALLHGPVDAQGRLPLWREGAFDLELPPSKQGDVPRTLLLQRIAKPAAPDASRLGRAWTHAGYVAWQVTADEVLPVEFPLVPVEQEGVWDCDGEPPLQKLTCIFRRLGPHSEAAAEKRDFVLLPGLRAAFKLLPPEN